MTAIRRTLAAWLRAIADKLDPPAAAPAVTPDTAGGPGVDDK